MFSTKLTRRRLLQGTAGFALGGLGLSGYALGIEPYRLVIRQYELSPKQWAAGPDIRIVAIADLHICEPWLPLDRVRDIVRQANALEPDLIVLLGDYTTNNRFVRRSVPHDAWAAELAKLEAPLGRFAILGNHDWWEDVNWQITREGPTLSGEALRGAGIPVLENDSRRLVLDGKPFWISGLGDQWAFWMTERRRNRLSRFGFDGRHDLPKTLAGLKDDAPAILLAHEPDIFAETPARFALQLSGHTHGGQVQLLGWAPRVPSIFGSRYLYGHITERDAAGEEKHLIVSGGIGCSGAPVRFGRPPELVVVDLKAPDAASKAAST